MPARPSRDRHDGAVRPPAGAGLRAQHADRRCRSCRLLRRRDSRTAGRRPSGHHRHRRLPGRCRRDHRPRDDRRCIEGAVSRVSGVKSISSSSSFGRSRVTVEFNDGVDLNVAASDMRDAVGRVANQLPDDADAPRIVKADANADAVMRLAVTSDNMSVEDMTILVEDQIARHAGGGAGRRRRAGLWRPREDLPHRHRPGASWRASG